MPARQQGEGYATNKHAGCAMGFELFYLNGYEEGGCLQVKCECHPSIQRVGGIGEICLSLGTRDCLWGTRSPILV